MTISILICPKCGTSIMGSEREVAHPGFLRAHQKLCPGGGTPRRVAKVGKRKAGASRLGGLPLEGKEFAEGVIETAMDEAVKKGVKAVMGFMKDLGKRRR